MTSTHTLPAELTIYHVAELHPEFKSWLQAPPEPCLEVHAQNVAEVDAAGIQLLLSLQNSLSKQNRRLALLQPSPALVSSCQALGTQGLLASILPKEVSLE